MPCSLSTSLLQKGNESILLFTPSKPSAIFKTCKFTRPYNIYSFGTNADFFGHAASIHRAYLDTNDPAQLNLIIALIVVLPVLVIVLVSGIGIFVYCVIKTRKKKIKKQYSRRYNI